jgi:hypothetical protein
MALSLRIHDGAKTLARTSLWTRRCADAVGEKADRLGRLHDFVRTADMARSLGLDDLGRPTFLPIALLLLAAEQAHAPLIEVSTDVRNLEEENRHSRG